MTPQPRLGFCCKFIPEVPPGQYRTKKAAHEALLAVNQTSVTMSYLGRLEPKDRLAKIEVVVGHNLNALAWQVNWVAERPPLERLLRMASSLLPGYTHPVARGFYAEPGFARTIRDRLAKIGETARASGVRLSMHPGPFCILASKNPAAAENGVSEFEYHAEIMAMMGYGSGWHPHGAHLNIHVGARDPGIEGFRGGLARLSETARNLVTVENDENCFGLDTVLKLADAVPIVLDLHHHWVESRGQYIEPDDPRIATIVQSWRGVRPLAHISVSREALLDGHDRSVRPDFVALREGGISWRDLAAHSDLMWNRAVNDLVARHLAWADFEVEAKSKNLASAGLAAQITAQARPRAAA